MNQAMQVLTSHASEEWYTPPRYIELARQVLGGIDLDPASDPVPQEWIRAGRYYTQQEDGLSRPWFGRVWLNPPYGKTGGESNQSRWSRYLVGEYQAGRVTAAVLLVNSTHGYRWYEELWQAWPVCLAAERISFIRPDGSTAGPAKRGQTFVYLGPDTDRFCQVFRGVGRVLR